MPGSTTRGTRLEDLGPVRDPLLAQLRAHRQEGEYPLRGLRRIPRGRCELPTLVEPDRGAAPGMRAALGFVFVIACSAAGDRAVPPLQVRHSVEGDGTRLALVAAPGIRINARLQPALELADGTILRFHSPRLTAD